MVDSAGISESLGEGSARDYERLTELFKEKRFLAYSRKVTDTDARVLLAAANNRQEFFALCEWAGKTGLASKPTFSRRKTFFQRLGVLGEDEKVPRGFGRPRLRLTLDRARFREVYGAEL